MLIFVADKMIVHSLIVSTMKTEREKRATRVTLYGAAINIILVIFKLIAGVVGQSAAMIADGIHSLSDLLTDAVVIIFMKLSSRPQDEDHDYGHGKYETLATAIIGMALFVVGLGICYGGVVKIWAALQGGQLGQPGWIALAAALLSIALKEWCFQFTVRTGRAIQSETVVANAWHHRSDIQKIPHLGKIPILRLFSTQKSSYCICDDIIIRSSLSKCTRNNGPDERLIKLPCPHFQEVMRRNLSSSIHIIRCLSCVNVHDIITKDILGNRTGCYHQLAMNLITDFQGTDSI